MTLTDLQAVLELESEAISLAAKSLGEAHLQAAEWIKACTGRVITCGVGKSGHIARKAAATFASTGTASFFLHAAERGVYPSRRRLG